ncbi:MAG: HisA/HisF-related TIM barrel protein, partial [Planctomycetaceae bacterium]
VDRATIGDMQELARLGFHVIASGGVSSLSDVRNLVAAHHETPHLDGAIIGRALYERAMTLPDALLVTRNHG